MFLTLEDPNAFIKGSRDPLGVQVIWYHFGRKLVSNLTTQSASIRGFSVLLLGRYLAEKILDENRVEEEIVEKTALDTFLRVEQICAYVRHLSYDDSEIRGINRVKKNCSANPGEIRISPDPSGSIMSDQKAYGLWGLYSVPARISGLIPDEGLGVSEIAREFIEEVYWPKLEDYEKEIYQLVAHDGILDTSTPDKVFKCFESCMNPMFNEIEREFYTQRIRNNSSCADSSAASINIQKELAELMLEHWESDQRISRQHVQLLADRANGGFLRDRLDEVMRLESVLSIATTVFNLILSSDGEKIKSVASSLANKWGRDVPNIQSDSIDNLIEELNRVSDTEVLNGICRFHQALFCGNYTEVVMHLINWAKRVAELRDGSPWVTLKSGDKLDVKYRRPETPIPKKKELQYLWRHSYFFDSLHSITHQLNNKV